jgi:hypothetical protein
MPNFFLSHKRMKVAGRMAGPPSDRAGRAPDLKQTRRDPAKGPPDSAVRFAAGKKSENALALGVYLGRLQERRTMKLFTGWVMAAGVLVTAGAAHAQMLAPHQIGSSTTALVSDVGGPYAAMPPEAPVPGYGPILLPAPEVYTVVRESGFSPLGIPHQRGLIYTISVINRDGDDGRLVVDARTGRIIRFVPAYRMGDNFNDDVTYGPVGPLPPISRVRGVPRPPASIPRVASRTPAGSVPMPKASPPRAGEPKPLATKPAPEPTQQSAAVQTKPADASAAPPAAAPAIVPATPAAPQIQPTQEMPKVQGLE